MLAEACRAAARVDATDVQGHEGFLAPACHGLQGQRQDVCNRQKPSRPIRILPQTAGSGIRVMSCIQELQLQLWLLQGWQGQLQV